MIIFNTVRWRNLLSTGNIFTEISLDSHSTTLIVGENGQGKSTLLDAISFGLFNKPFRRITKPQLVNSITGKDLVVEIEFTINNTKYAVVRGIKPDVFELYKNGKLMNQDADKRDYQKILEKQILRVNHKSFCQVVMLGSATYTPFMSLPAQQRRETIEDLLDLQIFTQMNIILKKQISDNTIEFDNTNIAKRLAESKLSMLKDNDASTHTNNKKIIEEREKQIESSKVLINDALTEINLIAKNLQELNASVANNDALVKKLSTYDSLYSQLNTKILNSNKTIDFFDKNDICPTCKQDIDNHFKCETIDAKKKTVEEVKAGIDKLQNERQKIANALNEQRETQKKIHDLILQESQLTTKMSNWKDNIRSWEHEIESFKEHHVTTSNKTLIAATEKELKSIEKKYKVLHDNKTTLLNAATILKDTGIKAKIIKQFIPIINKYINKYLAALDFFVNFELDENFNETIKSRFRDDFSYASFSEGEKFRINVALLFAWRAISRLRNSINCNLLIMDEVFDSSLDEKGNEEFAKLLLSLTQGTNVFIISHKTDNLTDRFDRVIRFQKNKNFSQIAE